MISDKHPPMNTLEDVDDRFDIPNTHPTEIANAVQIIEADMNMLRIVTAGLCGSNDEEEEEEPPSVESVNNEDDILGKE